MGLLTRNIGWKLVALIISAGLWMVINHEAELSTVSAARLEFKNIAPGLDITGGAPERIELRVHGPSGRITPSMLRDLAVVLDCSRVAHPGVYTFNLNGHHASLPDDVAVDSSVPSQLQITFERDVAREIPVVPRYSRPPPPGYKVAHYQFTPAALTVTGPESHVEVLQSVETDPIDLGAIAPGSAANTFERRIAAHLTDPQVRLAGPTFALTYKATIEKTPR